MFSTPGPKKIVHALISERSNPFPGNSSANFIASKDDNYTKKHSLIILEADRHVPEA